MTAEQQPHGTSEEPGAGAPPLPGDLAPPPCVYTLRLVRVTSFLVITQRRVAAKSGSAEQLKEFYRTTLIQNAVLGWWGFPFGVIWTPIAMLNNRKALKKLNTLAADGRAAAGWFPDPTGRHGARYWDGAQWTDKVSDVATDHLNSAEQADTSPVGQAVGS